MKFKNIIVSKREDLIMKTGVVIVGLAVFFSTSIVGIDIFGDHIGGYVIRIEYSILSIILFGAIWLAFFAVLCFLFLCQYFGQPTCPWCGSRRQITCFWQLSSREKICEFCYRHYWHRGWRNLSGNPVKIFSQPIWFLLPFQGERNIIIFVLIVLSVVLVFLGNLTQLPALILLGRDASQGILIAVVGLICWQFIKIKWQRRVFRWQTEGGVAVSENGRVFLEYFHQDDEDDPREYAICLVLGPTNDRWCDVVIIKDIFTGKYKKIFHSRTSNNLR